MVLFTFSCAPRQSPAPAVIDGAYALVFFKETFPVEPVGGGNSRLLTACSSLRTSSGGFRDRMRGLSLLNAVTAGSRGPRPSRNDSILFMSCSTCPSWSFVRELKLSMQSG